MNTNLLIEHARKILSEKFKDSFNYKGDTIEVFEDPNSSEIASLFKKLDNFRDYSEIKLYYDAYDNKLYAFDYIIFHDRIREHFKFDKDDAVHIFVSKTSRSIEMYPPSGHVMSEKTKKRFKEEAVEKLEKLFRGYELRFHLEENS